MKSFKLFVINLTAIMIGFFAFSGTALANNHNNDPCKKDFLGFPRWYEYLTLDTDCRITGPSKDALDNDGNPIIDKNGENVTTVDIAKATPLVLIAVIDILLRLAGMVAFAYIIISGFKFVLAQGNADKEKAARQTVINAAIGLVITIVAIGLTTSLGRFLGT